MVERYDRLPVGDGRVRRIHQEDMCQALGLQPTAKYQSDGGPSPEQIIALLRQATGPRVAGQEIGLAMKIGSEYRVAAITGRHWRDFAAANGLDPDATVARVDDLARRLPGAFREAASADAVTALGSGLPGRLAARIGEHVERCRAGLQR